MIEVNKSPIVTVHDIRSTFFPSIKYREISIIIYRDHSHTRSDSGRRARDTFTSLKKTCRKLGVSFWEYLQDRIQNMGNIPQLADLIREQAENST